MVVMNSLGMIHSFFDLSVFGNISSLICLCKCRQFFKLLRLEFEIKCTFTYFYYPKQPHDWDEDEDGKWRPPRIPNPKYRGPWKPKVYPLALEISKRDSALISC